MRKSLATNQLQSTSFEADLTLGGWRIVTLAPGMNLGRTVSLPKQTHGGNILEATSGALNDTSADGVIVRTNEAAGIQTADCVPVVIVTDNLAMALHVSRKTLIRGLMDNVTSFISPAEITHIWIGPHICEFHFAFEEEGPDIRTFRLRYPKAVHFHKGKVYLSLRKALKQVFNEWNVHPDRIVTDGRCTFEQLSLPSYKRSKANGDTEKIDNLVTAVWRNT